jgi:hypothetical protein
MPVSSPFSRPSAAVGVLLRNHSRAWLKAPCGKEILRTTGGGAVPQCRTGALARFFSPVRGGRARNGGWKIWQFWFFLEPWSRKGDSLISIQTEDTYG